MSNLTPGTVVTVQNGNRDEDGIVGYVCRTLPDNGDDVLVGIISAPGSSPYATKGGTRLSYRSRNLRPLSQ